MVVSRAALLEDIVVVDANGGIVGPCWVGVARNIWVKLVDDSVTTCVGIAMELDGCHGADVVIAIVQPPTRRRSRIERNDTRRSRRHQLLERNARGPNAAVAVVSNWGVAKEGAWRIVGERTRAQPSLL